MIVVSVIQAYSEIAAEARSRLLGYLSPEEREERAEQAANAERNARFED